MSPQDTLGFKQNNPLNMRPLGGGQLWHGQTGSANGFCVFSEPRWCFRGWIMQAHTYRTFWNCQSVMDYIRHYAPPEDDNDPVAYALSVEKFMGLAPADALAPTNAPFDLDARKLDFIRGQMAVEIGGVPYNEELISEGLSWAGNR